MIKTETPSFLHKVDQLRRELVDLAFTLECRGRLDAADVAMTTSARLAELCDEAARTSPPVLSALD